jgi:ABC-type enterochelin transport system permease subunit
MFGGQRYPGQYLLVPIAFVLMSALCSAHLLTLYYLLQPYTENIKVKNHVYTVMEVVSEAVTIAVCWIPAPAWILVPALIALNALYIFLATKLVRKFSPKHWRVRT